MYTYIVYLHIFTFRTWNNMFTKNLAVSLWFRPIPTSRDMPKIGGNPPSLPR